VDQSNLYSAQKNSDFRLDVPILNRFLGILVFSGYNSAPTEKMYWFTSPDITFPLVWNTLSRSHYLKVKSALHLADNDKVDSKIERQAASIAQKLEYLHVHCQLTNQYHGRHDMDVKC
jgi:hypothetical protein